MLLNKSISHYLLTKARVKNLRRKNAQLAARGRRKAQLAARGQRKGQLEAPGRRKAHNSIALSLNLFKCYNE